MQWTAGRLLRRRLGFGAAVDELMPSLDVRAVRARPGLCCGRCSLTEDASVALTSTKAALRLTFYVAVESADTAVLGSQ